MSERPPIPKLADSTVLLHSDEITEAGSGYEPPVKEIEAIRENESSSVEDRAGRLFVRVVDSGHMEQAESLVAQLLQSETAYRKFDSGYDLLSLSNDDFQAALEKALDQSDDLITAASESTYRAFLTRHADKPALDVIRLAVTSNEVPESEKPKLRDYLRLASADVVANDQDRQRITVKINRLTVADLPAVAVFITTDVLQDPEISTATKDAIAAEFDLPKPEITTGSDLREALETQEINPGTGETRPLYHEDNPLKYRNGVEAFVGPDGKRVLQARLTDGQLHVIPFDTEAGDSIGLYASQLALWRVLDDKELSHFMDVLFGIKESPWRQDTVASGGHAAQVINALRGGLAGYDGEILDQRDLDYIAWACEQMAAGGESKARYLDSNRINEHLQEQGVLDDDGRLDLDGLREQGAKLRRVWMGNETPKM